MSRALIALALAANSGCFASWVTTQATGTQRLWDEGARDVAVPLPGATERLAIGLPMQPSGERVRLSCAASQIATDEVHHSAFRYGKKFKLGTAVMFALEGALGALMLVTADREHSANYLYGGLLAADAVGAGAMLFFPRKEVFTREPRPVITALHTVCPDGLVLDVASDTFPVDATGHVGELGDAALDAWMAAPNGPLLVTFGGRTAELRVDEDQRCAWERTRGKRASCLRSPGLAAAETALEVPLGTLSAAN
jgi:hypothetical protein